MCKVVGLGIPSPGSMRSQGSQTNSFAASMAARYLVWVEEVVTMDCCFEMRPPKRKERCIPRSNSSWRSHLPSLALVYPTISPSPIVYIMLQLGQSANCHRMCLMLSRGMPRGPRRHFEMRWPPSCGHGLQNRVGRDGTLTGNAWNGIGDARRGDRRQGRVGHGIRQLQGVGSIIITHQGIKQCI